MEKPEFEPPSNLFPNVQPSQLDPFSCADTVRLINVQIKTLLLGKPES